VFTATVIVKLADAGKIAIDAPVAGALPGFSVQDSDVTMRVTPRHLLSHTSGIGGDLMPDTGRGDDALERFAGLCAELGQDIPLGVTYSYSNASPVSLRSG
jgi:CubicO group peptidase (beta-lactamase class C family)